MARWGQTFVVPTRITGPGAHMSQLPPFRASLRQLKPRKGDVARNLDEIRRSISTDADLLVFPEAVLSGYLVEGAVHEVARSAD